MTTYQTQQQRLSPGRLCLVGALTIVTCIIANSIVRTIAVTFLGVSASFQPLQLPTIIVSTTVYLLLAIGALLLVNRMSRRPVWTYRILASVCLLLSLAFPLLALTGVFPTPGMSESIFWSMVAMHVLSAAIVMVVLPEALIRK